MGSKRYFYYMECEEQGELFKYLDEAVDEGYIDYSIDKPNAIIIIENITIDNDDDIYDYLNNMDAIEDKDYIEDIDEDYDDFFDEDYDDE